MGFIFFQHIYYLPFQLCQNIFLFLICPTFQTCEGRPKGLENVKIKKSLSFVSKEKKSYLCQVAEYMLNESIIVRLHSLKVDKEIR